MNATPVAMPYPLYWPEGFPRTRPNGTGGFKTALNAAANNVKKSLELFGKDTSKPVSNIIISSNLLPLQDSPSDPGVSVWFDWDGSTRCIAIDRYEKVEANLQAVHHIVEARRTEMRHGGIQIVRQTFKGFTALPAPAGQGAEHWTKVLKLPPTATQRQIDEAYRAAARAAAGDEQKLLTVNLARDAAKVDTR